MDRKQGVTVAEAEMASVLRLRPAGNLSQQDSARPRQASAPVIGVTASDRGSLSAIRTEQAARIVAAHVPGFRARFVPMPADHLGRCDLVRWIEVNERLLTLGSDRDFAHVVYHEVAHAQVGWSSPMHGAAFNRALRKLDRTPVGYTTRLAEMFRDETNDA